MTVPVPTLVTVNVYLGTKVAVTAIDWVIDTTHVPVGFVHAPDQPLKMNPVPAVAVNVTDVPDANVAEHVAPQLIPVGLDETVPVPAFDTVNAYLTVANVAVTVRAADMVTVHVRAVPTQPPDQLVNEKPAAGAAVSVTTVPDAKPAEHVAPQLMPAGEEVTVPVPDFVTVSANVGTNVAVTERA